MRILVTGASGWIGTKVVNELVRRRMAVIALDVAQRKAGPRVDYLPVDLRSEQCVAMVEAALQDCVDVVVHCAGYAHRPHETPEEVTRFWEINREGTRRMLEIARRVGASRFVYVSSIAFYDWAKGADYAEDGALAATTAYAGSKLAGERLCTESGLDWRVARLGTVFGEGDRANFAKLAAALAHRRFVVPGAGSARKSVLPIGLAAELLADLAVRPNVPHRLLNLAVPGAPTLAEICRGFSSACGFPRPRSVPLPLLRALARIGDVVAKQRPNFPLTTVNLRKLTSSTSVDTRRMQQCWPDREWGTFETSLVPSADYYRNLVA